MPLACCLSPRSKPLAAGWLDYLKRDLIMACQPEPLLLCLSAQCECVRTSSLQVKLHWSQETCTKNKSSPSLGFSSGWIKCWCKQAQVPLWLAAVLRDSGLPILCCPALGPAKSFLPHDIPLQEEISLRTSITSAYSCGENFRYLRGIYVTDKILFS